MNYTTRVILLLAFLSPILGFGQEYLLDLEQNFVLKNQKSIPTYSKSSAPLNLPFIDDFSYNDVYPKASLWQDNDVYINHDYPDNPITYGVATFEGLMFNGEPYSYNPNDEGIGDYLTSQPIDISTFNNNDSLYLSFFIQGGGLGNKPESKDSLVIEFLNNNGNWNKIWGSKGIVNAPFEMIMIPVLGNQFFHNNFQFRFRAKATLSGNFDHWHVDYVYLDKDRTTNQTTVHDVAIQYPTNSILANYTEMPWRQFKGFESTELNPTLPFNIVNNHVFDKVIAYKYKVRDGLTGTNYVTSNVTTINPFAASSDQTVNEPMFTIPTFPLSEEEVCLEIEQIARMITDNSPDFLLVNDTCTHKQSFKNYFAYDDGTAEQIYGLNGTAAQFAYKFRTNRPDSLRGMWIHLAHYGTDARGKTYNLKAWSSLSPLTPLENGITTIVAEYVEEVNGFSLLLFNEPIAVNGDFYVGYQQGQSESLNIGFDKNNDASIKMFYNIGTGFQTTTLAGAPMLRPIVGAPVNVNVGVNDIKNSNFNIYPNPTTNFISIDNSESIHEVKIFDLTGRLLLNTKNTQQIDLTAFSAGTYLLQITNQSNQVIATQKIIKL